MCKPYPSAWAHKIIAKNIDGTQSVCECELRGLCWYEPRRASGGRRAGSIARAAFSSPFGEARGEGAGERARGEVGRYFEAGVGEPGRAAPAPSALVQLYRR